MDILAPFGPSHGSVNGEIVKVIEENQSYLVHDMTLREIIRPLLTLDQNSHYYEVKFYERAEEFYVHSTVLKEMENFSSKCFIYLTRLILSVETETSFISINPNEF